LQVREESVEELKCDALGRVLSCGDSTTYFLPLKQQRIDE